MYYIGRELARWQSSSGVFQRGQFLGQALRIDAEISMWINCLGVDCGRLSPTNEILVRFENAGLTAGIQNGTQGVEKPRRDSEFVEGDIDWTQRRKLPQAGAAREATGEACIARLPTPHKSFP